MRFRLAPLLALLLVGCTIPQYLEDRPELPYSCNDLVIVGRIATLNITGHAGTDANAPFPDWLNEYSLQVRVKRVIRGSEQRSVVAAIRVAHGQIRPDKDFLIVLSPLQGDRFSLSSAALMSNRPTPTEPCLWN